MEPANPWFACLPRQKMVASKKKIEKYNKKPTKKPKSLFKPHNKQLSMPEYLRKKYEKNNK